MGRPALSRDRVDEVARTYDMVRRQNPDQSITAKMVWEQLRNKNPPRFRKVQALVAQFKQFGTPSEDAPWHPSWDDSEFRECAAHLLGMQAAFLGLLGRPMYTREATWASRLRTILEGYHPYTQVPFVVLYAQRDIMSTLTREKLDTADLDGMLMIDALYSEDPGQYELAVQAGAVPSPPSAHEIIQTLNFQASEKAQEFFRVFGAFLTEHPEDPLRAIKMFDDAMGSRIKDWAVWSENRAQVSKPSEHSG